MKIGTVGQFEIHESDRHGKCTAGNKATTSIQIHQILHNGYLCLKSISYKVGDRVGRQKAIEKAKQFCKDKIGVSGLI